MVKLKDLKTVTQLLSSDTRAEHRDSGAFRDSGVLSSQVNTLRSIGRTSHVGILCVTANRMTCYVTNLNLDPDKCVQGIMLLNML